MAAMKRKIVAGLAISAVVAGSIYLANKETEPDYYVCAILPYEALHPDSHPYCTKEESERRRKYYQSSNIFPLGMFSDPRL